MTSISIAEETRNEPGDSAEVRVLKESAWRMHSAWRMTWICLWMNAALGSFFFSLLWLNPKIAARLPPQSLLVEILFAFILIFICALCASKREGFLKQLRNAQKN